MMVATLSNTGRYTDTIQFNGSYSKKSSALAHGVTVG